MRLYHIPICPFSQRLEILLELKKLNQEEAGITIESVDITKPRSPHILSLTGGTTALPVLELEDGKSLKESMVLMEYLEDRFPNPSIRRVDPYERAIENLMCTMADPLIFSGYGLVMNQKKDDREQKVKTFLQNWEKLSAFLDKHGSKTEPWLFDKFGWAETVYTPFFHRFVFVKYYEDVDIPEDDPKYARVMKWRDACVSHPATQQTSDEQVIKLYYDYALGSHDGHVPEGRKLSTFTFESDWRTRPMPPKDKYSKSVSDAELGLVAASSNKMAK